MNESTAHNHPTFRATMHTHTFSRAPRTSVHTPWLSPSTDGCAQPREASSPPLGRFPCIVPSPIQDPHPPRHSCIWRPQPRKSRTDPTPGAGTGGDRRRQEEPAREEKQMEASPHPCWQRADYLTPWSPVFPTHLLAVARSPSTVTAALSTSRKLDAHLLCAGWAGPWQRASSAADQELA